ncbi:agmatinase [Nocardioides caldifontis]|uniref:agmatinase n=1 Tax=Nocardioides caldifontis TaxID=2588938 RepID=UPI0011DFC2DC|nr:agmatinase [Nocardioides caldifontis]
MSQHPSPVGPLSGTEVPRYAGPSTFARLPRVDQVEKVDVAVIGAPFDTGVSYRPGARFGPAHIRQSSRLLRPYNSAQDVSPFAALQVADAGDMVINPFDIEEAIGQVREQAAPYVDNGTRLVTLGGDHTLALPLLRTVTLEHGPVAVLHFDAHLDTWDTYFGAPYTHGTPFRRASEEGLVDHSASMHVGIRGPLYDRADLEDDAAAGFRILSSRQFARDSLDGLIERMLDRLGDRPVYVSIDIDVLDPAHAPGTGTPEAGGLTSRELLEMIRALPPRNVVGADVVEVSPAYDHAELTGIAASHVVYELISAMALTHGKATS